MANPVAERLGLDKHLPGGCTALQTPGGDFQAGQGHPARAWCSLDLPFPQNLQLGIVINRVTWEFSPRPLNVS